MPVGRIPTPFARSDARRADLHEPAQQGDLMRNGCHGRNAHATAAGRCQRRADRDYGIQKAQAGGSVRATYGLVRPPRLSGNLVSRVTMPRVALDQAGRRTALPERSQTCWEPNSNCAYGVEKNETATRFVVVQGAAQDNPNAMGRLGSYHEEGKRGHTVDKLVALTGTKARRARKPLRRAGCRRVCPGLRHQSRWSGGSALLQMWPWQAATRPPTTGLAGSGEFGRGRRQVPSSWPMPGGRAAGSRQPCWVLNRHLCKEQTLETVERQRAEGATQCSKP
jgi:hypothetical protein